MSRTSQPARRPAIAAALGTALGVATLLAGCDFFRPSRPEVPTGAQLIARYNAPDTTLATLKLAIEDKSATSNSQTAYIGGFADLAADGQVFQAFFDDSTIARFPGQSLDWDASREQVFYANLSRLLPGYAFNFTWKVGYVPLQTAPEDELLATTATLYRNYRILAYRDGTDDQFVARGNAEIHFALIRGNWKIVQWRDHEASDADFNRGELSFGQLRLAGP